MKHIRKTYCFVDESGQNDAGTAAYFVAAVTCTDVNALRARIVTSEKASGIGGSKWRKANKARRYLFLQLMAAGGVGHGVCIGHFLRPTSLFDAVARTVERAIALNGGKDGRAIVAVDGIQKKKAEALTKMLRARGVRLEIVRKAEDESEPGIRLADRWAGCARSASRGDQEAIKALADACLFPETF